MDKKRLKGLIMQLPLMDEIILGNKKRRKLSIAERFKRFHTNNPIVYEKIVKIAREVKTLGKHKIGMSLIFERLRWLDYIETKDDEPFKLSNDYRAEYSRLVMLQETDLSGVFDIRQLRREKREGR
jgi:hypothetical protein